LAAYLSLTQPSATTLTMVGALGIYQITAAIVATLFIPAMAAQRMLWPALAELSARTIAFAVAGCAIYVGHASLAFALLGFPLAAAFWLAFAISLHTAFRASPGPDRLLDGDASDSGNFVVVRPARNICAAVRAHRSDQPVLGRGRCRRPHFCNRLALDRSGPHAAQLPGSGGLSGPQPAFCHQRSRVPALGGDLMWPMLLGGGAVAWGLYFVALLFWCRCWSTLRGRRTGDSNHGGICAAAGGGGCLGRLLLCTDRQAANAAFVAVGAVLSVTLKRSVGAPLWHRRRDLFRSRGLRRHQCFVSGCSAPAPHRPCAPARDRVARRKSRDRGRSRRSPCLARLLRVAPSYRVTCRVHLVWRSRIPISAWNTGTRAHDATRGSVLNTASGHERLVVRVVENRTDFDGLEAAWRALDALPGVHPFQQFGWVRRGCAPSERRRDAGCNSDDVAGTISWSPRCRCAFAD